MGNAIKEVVLIVVASFAGVYVVVITMHYREIFRARREREQRELQRSIAEAAMIEKELGRGNPYE